MELQGARLRADHCRSPDGTFRQPRDTPMRSSIFSRATRPRGRRDPAVSPIGHSGRHQKHRDARVHGHILADAAEKER